MARKRNRPNKRRNRRNRGVLYILTSSVLVLAAVAMGCAIFFRANWISVVGANTYTQEEIIAASGIKIGDNLFFLPRFQVGKDICSTLTYIDEVHVAQILPDGVEITVTECRPTAVIAGDGAWWALDAKGKVLERGALTNFAELAVVRGVTAVGPVVGSQVTTNGEQEEKLEQLIALTQAIQSRGMTGNVGEISFESSGEIHFTYDGRFTVEVPLRTDFVWKLRALEEVVDRLQVNETGRIDITRDDKVYFDPY